MEKSKFLCFVQLGFVQKQSSLAVKTSSQRGILITNNSQQLQACCIPGVLGFDLKVKWQVFGLAEQVC